MRIIKWIALAGLSLTAFLGLAGAQANTTSIASDAQPDGKGNKPVDAPRGPQGAASTAAAAVVPITYHGGPIMTGTTNIYYIWYGNWSGNTALSILTNLAQSIGGSSYFNINTTYTNGSGGRVSNSVHFIGSTTDNYSQGKSLSDAQIKTVVSSAITSGRLPKDANGVYFVLTSQDVTASSGFCTQYCGWHTRTTILGTDIKYSFVGNSARCLSSCAAQSVSPNNNPGADGMASVLAHELEETVTDPALNAWYDKSGAENGDKCAWTFGTTTSLSGGAKYNMILGSLKYLIQQNWVQVPNGGYCAKSY